MKHVGLYTRVSTLKQAFKNEGSLEVQEDCLRSYLGVRQKQQAGLKEAEEWQFVGLYREAGKSAKNTQRPELQRLLHDIRTDRVNTIMVTKIDRITRSLRDFYDLWGLFEQKQITFISLAESFDTSTIMGRAMLKLVVLFAEMERERIAERVRETTEHRIGTGHYCGGPVLGYDFDPNNKGMLIVNPEEAALVRLIDETYLKIGSVLATTGSINKRGYRTKTYLSREGKPMGGTPFFNTGIHRVLKNPLYIGKIDDGENLVDGKQEAIVPLDLWNRVQRRLEAQVRTRHNDQHQRQYTFLLEGLVRCGQCGNMLSPRSAHGRNAKYFYYGCTTRWHQGRTACNMKDVSAPTLDGAMVERIKGLGQERDYVERLASGSNVSTQHELQQLELSKKTLERQRAKVRRKLERLSDLLTASKAYGAEDQLLKMIGEASKEDQAIQVALDEVVTKKDSIRQQTVDPDLVCKNLHTFTELFDAATEAEKQALVKLILHQVIWTPAEVKYALYEQPSAEALDELTQVKGENEANGSPLLSGWYTTSTTERTTSGVLWGTGQISTAMGPKGYITLQVS